jgi:hypothetical protein
MTSLTRYWQEAKNALGQEFLPQMRATISGLSDLLKWVKDNADMIAKLAGAIGSAALGVAIGKFVGWIGGAKKAIDGLTAAISRNWVTLLITGALMAGQALYSMYQDSLSWRSNSRNRIRLLPIPPTFCTRLMSAGRRSMI